MKLHHLLLAFSLIASALNAQAQSNIVRPKTAYATPKVAPTKAAPAKPTPANAKVPTAESTGNTFIITGENTCSVSKGAMNRKAISIPKAVLIDGKTYTVTAIDNDAFMSCDAIVTINIPSSVTTISDFALFGCSNLANVNVAPENPAYTSIDGVLFTKDQKTILHYPRSRKGSYNIPSTVTTINKEAFPGCYYLTKINIPSSVTTIDNGAMGFFGTLASINVAPDNPAYTSIDGILFTKDIKTIIYCPQSHQGNYNMPETITTIGDGAFRDCDHLTSIKMPNTVTTIGESAFFGCEALTTINIPNSVTAIGSEAFRGCSALTSINIPNGVTTIGSRAFSECNGLTSIDLPASVTAIGNQAFWHSSAIASINVAPGNTAYFTTDGILFTKGQKVIVYCPENRKGNYKISSSVTTIGSDAFNHCKALTTIDIPNSVTTIESSAFSDCFALTTINIPEGVTTIGDFAFYACINLSNINLPNSVTTIGSCIFRNCKALTTINCYATKPPTTDHDPFFPRSARIHVPRGCADAYRAAEYWKKNTIIDDL